jgi:hypothetical protein
MLRALKSAGQRNFSQLLQDKMQICKIKMLIEFNLSKNTDFSLRSLPSKIMWVEK